ncbi:SIMPL domain-containing protein [Cellulosilyticum sp. I15G10I2]|uniref:SIMPL domain-containing protein n=1 Tax=Cellulosilyticum sp. I15G10I2 TaxID=1892843 RepID=UPI00085C70EB|nr:SIMPL domain-containing protein [Cellulosilyticum sp. I15G10I2]
MAQPLSMNHCSNSNNMTLNGQGHVMATPDLAVIHLGVQTTGPDLSEIQSENARISQRVIQSLRQAGVTEIKTIQYAINKLYEYENGRQIDKGYSVRNILEIKTPNMDEVGNIIDTAVNMGANVVLFISFELSEPELYYQQALNLAVDQAIQKARTISENLRIRLNPIPIRIIEGSAPSIPRQQFYQEVAATPILPGDLRIEAFVTADFCYAK